MSFTSTVVLAYPPIMEENKSAEYINMSTVQKIRTILRKNNLERKISSNNHLPTDKLSGRDRKISSVSSGSRNRAGSESSSFVGSSSSYLYLILPIELYIISLPAKEPSAGLFGSKNLLKYKSRKIFIFGVTTSTTL